MTHASPSAVTVEAVSRCGTGSDASERRDGFLARPVPFAETLRQMGRPRGWGILLTSMPASVRFRFTSGADAAFASVCGD